MSIPWLKKYNFKKGKNHRGWKGGRIKNHNGYIWVYLPSHPLARKRSRKGYVLEHRLVMCKKLGRIIKSKEIVHHLNGVRDDNRPENLVLTSTSKHIAGHNAKRVWKKESKLKQTIKASLFERDANGRFLKYPNGVLPSTMVPGSSVPFLDLKY